MTAKEAYEYARPESKDAMKNAKDKKWLII
jgi:hypothetical protein